MIASLDLGLYITTLLLQTGLVALGLMTVLVIIFALWVWWQGSAHNLANDRTQ